MSNPFDVRISEVSGQTQVHVVGPVNEHSIFPSVSEKPFVRIHLEKASGLNSIGIRAWILWLKRFGSSAEIHLDGAPLTFVKAFNQVKGALPENARVDSFFVPFISDSTGERRDLLFVRDLHYGTAEGLQVPTVLDGQGNLMEMDILADYFRFLER